MKTKMKVPVIMLLGMMVWLTSGALAQIDNRISMSFNQEIKNNFRNWISLGPAVSGINFLTMSPSNPNIIYIKAWNNALYKTTDSGNTWKHIGSFSICGNIGAVAFDPKTPEVIYAIEGIG